MTGALSHTANAGRHSLKDRRDDLYETPPAATEALLRHEPLPINIWEPACGRGAIAKVLHRNGKRVWSSDLVDHGYVDARARVDFLLEKSAPFEDGAIVTNPPYKLAGEFVSHGLTLLPKVVMLLRLAFLESERRRPILDSGHLARVYVFRNRLPMMHREGWSGPRSTNSIAFAWFVWERDHAGPTELRRISWS